MTDDDYFADPLIAMEHILDSLKLLDYENSFCKQKYVISLRLPPTHINISFTLYRGFKPISKAYFATASSKASEQFIYFISLVSWLLSVNQHQVSGWNKYDDPVTAS